MAAMEMDLTVKAFEVAAVLEDDPAICNDYEKFYQPFEKVKYVDVMGDINAIRNTTGSLSAYLTHLISLWISRNGTGIANIPNLIAKLTANGYPLKAAELRRWENAALVQQ